MRGQRKKYDDRAVPRTAPIADFVSVARQQEEAMLASGDYRKCPHCAEVIKAEANVCRFCQRDVAARASAYR
ncbi:MAG: hypothetical protein EOO38_27975 [Cytophagaceae bacterium]|nr:MAG: hypothetical protein EOO38_27975 [Cytophagaceae bacterium]